MSDLKPCPFCGGEVPELRGDKEFGWFIACFKCNIIIDDCKTEAEAAEAWNARYERTCKCESYFNGYNLTHVCTGCGYLSEHQWNYCPNCGTRIKEDADAD